MVRQILTENLLKIAGEWDVLGPLRHDLITSGLDTSFDRILSPYMLKPISAKKVDKLLDAGCGTGDLTVRLAKNANHVDAVDISNSSIKLAKSVNASNNIAYYLSSVEGFSSITASMYDACTANMLLMDTPDAFKVLTALKGLLKPKGLLILTIFHPFFYDFLKGNDDNFKHYLDNQHRIDKFSMTNYKNGSVLRSHFHRPITFYVKSLCRLGFHIISLDELAPPKSLSRQYGNFGRYPRFLGIVAQARPTSSR